MFPAFNNWLLWFVPVCIFSFIFLPRLAPVSGQISPELVSIRAVATPSILLPIALVPKSPPVRLIIPTINLNAKITRVGLTKDGAIDAPANPNDTAWYDGSPLPGEIGSAIIDGHSGWSKKRPVAFDNIDKLKAGDKIYIQNDLGSTTIFLVRKIAVYDKDSRTADYFGPNDGKSHLNLITCNGAWLKAEQKYANRLVVFADKLDAQDNP